MSMRQYQIEELLMNAHRSEIDLIEEYFSKEDSLDLITNQAHQLLQLHSSPEMHDTIKKNLSECIVVKMQIEKKSLKGLVKKALSKMGFHFGKSREITRAEKLLEGIKKQAR